MRVVVAIVALAACGPHHTGGAKMTDCRSVIDGFATAQPARLRPLAAGCTYADGAAYQPSDASSTGTLGETHRPLQVRYLVSTALPRIRVWSTNGAIEMLDADRPPGKLADYVAVFGPPEAKLDYTFGDVRLPQGELVWPSKGVAIVANEELVKGIVRVAVFGATSLDDYRARLRYDGATEDEDKM